MISKPWIGVTGPSRGGWPAWIMTRFAVWRAGGRAVRITPSQPCTHLEQLDGLIIGGGADIDPQRYGEALLNLIKNDSEAKRHPLEFIFHVLVFVVRRLFRLKIMPPGDKARDELEFSLLAHALQLKLPILGICRGAQLINVHFGGTLYQDLRSFYVENPNLRTTMPRKIVNIAPHSLISTIIHDPMAGVNSLHSQAINELGDGLQVSAREANGVIQAIEHSTERFVLGVQWHPEYLPLQSVHVDIFRRFIDYARDKTLTKHVSLNSAKVETHKVEA